MGFSRQEYWSGLPFPSPGALPDPGIEPESPALQPVSLLSELPRKPFSTNGSVLFTSCFLKIYLGDLPTLVYRQLSSF